MLERHRTLFYRQRLAVAQQALLAAIQAVARDGLTDATRTAQVAEIERLARRAFRVAAEVPDAD